MSGATPLIPTPFRGKTSLTLGKVPVGQGSSQLIELPLESFINFALMNATVTNANDAVKITGQDAALGVSNPAYIALRSHVTAGRKVLLAASADTTINLTGAHWGAGGRGDLSGSFLRVYAINDNGTLKFGVGYVGGRESILNTDSSATPASVTTPEMLLVSSTLSAGTWACREIGYFYANFDDTGGAAEDLWAVQTGTQQLVTGKSPDGIWQPFNTTVGGFDGAALPTWTSLNWTQFGKTVVVHAERNATGTSNATTFTAILPVTAKALYNGSQSRAQDNGAAVIADMNCRTVAGATTLNLYKSNALGAWTNVNAKAASFSVTYEANL